MSKYNLKPNVLIVEDDEAIVSLLEFTLEKEGFKVSSTDNGEDALFMVKENKPDIILLDWMLPEISGIQVCTKIRSDDETRNIPIIMLSARGEEADRVEGLQKGVDDYIVKPFSPKELIARIEAIFRRIRPMFVAKELVFDKIVMNLSTNEVKHGNTPVKLGPVEYKILKCLLENPQRVLSRDQLIRKVWGDELEVEPRTIDVHVNRIRKAFNASKGQVVQTIRGAGYKLRPESDLDLL